VDARRMQLLAKRNETVCGLANMTGLPVDKGVSAAHVSKLMMQSYIRARVGLRLTDVILALSSEAIYGQWARNRYIQ